MSEPPRPAKPPVDVNVTFGNRLARLLWGIVETLLYRPSPRLAHGWRRMLLRLFGARIGKHVHPYPRTRIWAPWNLVMDEGSSIDNDVTCLNNTLLHLGAWSVVSQQSFLTTASRDLDRPGRPVTGAPIHIGPGAWVAVQCFVGPGVTIGEHAVVGARSTITRDVAAMSVVAGSPPRLLRMRTAASIQR